MEQPLNLFGGSEPEANGGSGDAESSGPVIAPFLTFGTTGGDSGGSGSGDTGGFDPSIHVSPDKRNNDGSFTRKRGRKSGSASGGNRHRGSQASNQANIESLASILAIVHAGLASATRTPELALESDDAEALAKASERVLVEFDIQPNPKVQAIVGLVMTAGAVYGPKVVLIRMRKKEERETKQ